MDDPSDKKRFAALETLAAMAPPPAKKAHVEPEPGAKEQSMPQPSTQCSTVPSRVEVGDRVSPGNLIDPTIRTGAFAESDSSDEDLSPKQYLKAPPEPLEVRIGEQYQAVIPPMAFAGPVVSPANSDGNGHDASQGRDTSLRRPVEKSERMPG